MDRDAELDAFKRLNLSLVASAFGYEIVRKKSTRHSVLMSSGSDKIVISQNGGDYVYFSVHEPTSSGTVIDLVQKAIEPGCSLGRVRQVLRPFLGEGYATEISRRYQDRYQAVIQPSLPDLPGVAERYARFMPIVKPHPYLCGERGVPIALLQSERLRERVRHCPRLGSVVFPHSAAANAGSNPNAPVSGYEIKGRGVTLFSKGGTKTLWQSAGFLGDRKLVVAESALDAISYLAVRGEEGTRVCSLSGQMNSGQPAILAQAISSMGEGSQVIAAFDNDPAGDQLTARLDEIVSQTGRADLSFQADRPTRRGADWNRVLTDSRSADRSLKTAFPSIGH